LKIMDSQKINWKIFFKNPEAAKADDFLRAFNSWIPDSPEVFIDVADYKHVHDGPLTVLVGHYVTYSLDASGRRLGLLYSRNRAPEGGAVSVVATFNEVLKTAKRVEEDKTLNGVRFQTNEFLFLINDRAAFPNNDETFRSLRGELDLLFSSLFGKGGYTLTRNADHKQRFQVTVSGKSSLTLNDLCEKSLKASR